MRQKLKIYHAESMNNGIRFYSKRHKNYVAIATLDEQGNISTEWTTTQCASAKKQEKEKISPKKIFADILFFITFFAVVYPLYIWALNKNIICFIRTAAIVNAISGLMGFLYRVYVTRKNERIKYRFHSAEHMVCDAYSKLNRVPSIEEIHQFSRFANDCSTNETTELLAICILVFVCSFIPNLLYSLIGLQIGIVLILILHYCGCLNFLQILTTITPTDTELMVAIAGMNVWLENEQKEKEISKFMKFLHRLFPRVFGNYTNY